MLKKGAFFPSTYLLPTDIKGPKTLFNMYINPITQQGVSNRKKKNRNKSLEWILTNEKNFLESIGLDCGEREAQGEGGLAGQVVPAAEAAVDEESEGGF